MQTLDIVLHREHKAWNSVTFDLEDETKKAVTSALQKAFPTLNNVELGVILADDDKLRALNKTYRGLDKPTNVLSFGYGETSFQKGILGDIFLSFETLEREADEQGKKFHHHYLHLIIHGVLHLLGYDHEHDPEAQEMEKLEIDILRDFNILNPYEF